MCDDAVREVAYDPNYDPKRKGEGAGGDYAAYFSVRLRVFCDEQEISIDDEVDGADERCKHYALFRGSQAVAVCRLSIEPPYAKIERVACLKEERGQGYARRLMLAVLRIVDEEHPNEIVAAHSQSAVLKFYERIGFVAVSREFLDEVDILHRSIVFPPRREKIRTLSLRSSPPSKHSEFAGDLYDGQVLTTIRRMLNEIENLSFIPLCSLVVSYISSLLITSSLHEALCTVALRAQRANGYAENYTPFTPGLSMIDGVSDEECLKAVAAKKMNTGDYSSVDENWKCFHSLLRLALAMGKMDLDAKESLRLLDEGLMMGRDVDGILGEMTKRLTIEHSNDVPSVHHSEKDAAPFQTSHEQ